MFRVVRAAGGQEIQRYLDLEGACVRWVKDPRSLSVQELATGSNTPSRKVGPQECCAALRRWLPQNKHFVSEDERRDMEQFIREACGGAG
jgi:hypothetical protein